MPATESNLRIARTTCLTLVNAMIFQQVLSGQESTVHPLARTILSGNVVASFQEQWFHILNKIDYEPIFQLATDILSELAGTPGIDSALKLLAEEALSITSKRASLRHDLMGRLYHLLLATRKRKYFGAFYTTVPASVLLLKLTLDPDEMSIDWSDKAALRKVMFADLACGTGTLLKATIETIIDNHVRACAAKGVTVDLKALHKVLIEDCIWGLDVIPFAIQLAGCALALHEPEAKFADMHLYTLPIGGVNRKLGSIELLAANKLSVQADLFGGAAGPAREKRTGRTAELVAIPQLDLCVMNPPFTRSVGGNLLFGNLPKAQRTRLQSELKKLVAKQKAFANITAGLGAVFVAAGHNFLKPDGHMSLVLERSLISGVAWKDTRTLLGNNYQVRYIVVSHEAGRWNFSENTKMSEVLIVARRLRPGEIPKATKVVNLWKRPTTSIQSLAVAQQIKKASGVLLAGVGTESLMLNETKVAEVLLCPPSKIQAGEWSDEASFAQTEMCRVASNLANGRVYVPSKGLVGTLPLTTLKELGDLGPDRRDIHDGFAVCKDETAYRAFWGHNSDKTATIGQQHNGYLSALSKGPKGRHLRDADLLWSRAGRLMIAEGIRLNTMKALAVRVEEIALSNTWWPFAIQESMGLGPEDLEKILVLWLNSTLGVLSLMGIRVETEGAWIHLKKPSLQQLKVLDASKLTTLAVGTLVSTYKKMCGQKLARLPYVAHDPIRAEMDSALMSAIGLDVDLGPIRQLLSKEPILSR